MCTAINFNGYFGRTLDYEYGFGEEAVTVPRGHCFEFRHRKSVVSRFSIVGMARKENGYPLFFDAMNEKGVAMAGLNFVGNAYFTKAENGAVASFELIPFVLSQAESAEKARSLLLEVEIADTPFSSTLAPAPLHWLVGDGEKSIAIESTEDGLALYDDPVGVLTNNPPFPYQMMNLNTYLGLSSAPTENRLSKGLDLLQYSRGMGAIGLPGDWSSASRFVRASFVRENAAKEKSVAHFFNILSSVAVPKGCMLLDGGEYEYTRYLSCMDLEAGVYYYKRYDSTEINTRSCAP